MTEGIDYFVRYVQFPNRANDGCTVVNDDGTFDIYLNTLYTKEHLKNKLQHELNHLKHEHFYRDDLSIELIESQANGTLAELSNYCPREYIREFSSLDALLEWYIAICRQNGWKPF